MKKRSTPRRPCVPTTMRSTALRVRRLDDRPRPDRPSQIRQRIGTPSRRPRSTIAWAADSRAERAPGRRAADSPPPGSHRPRGSMTLTSRTELAEAGGELEGEALRGGRRRREVAGEQDGPDRPRRGRTLGARDLHRRHGRHRRDSSRHGDRVARGHSNAGSDFRPQRGGPSGRPGPTWRPTGRLPVMQPDPPSRRIAPRADPADRQRARGARRRDARDRGDPRARAGPPAHRRSGPRAWSAPSTRRSASSSADGRIERFITSGISRGGARPDRRPAPRAAACSG